MVIVNEEEEKMMMVMVIKCLLKVIPCATHLEESSRETHVWVLKIKSSRILKIKLFSTLRVFSKLNLILRNTCSAY